MHTRPLVTILSLAASSLLGAASCTETRVVAVRGGLQNIEGAQGGIKAGDGWTRRTSDMQSLAARLYGELPGQPVDGNMLRRQLEDGTILLVSRSAAELVFHLRRTIRDEEWDLIYEHLLSKQLKAAYEELGLDPRQSVDFIRENAPAIVQLLAMLPSGDQTPGASFRSTGRNAYRLTVPGGPMNDIPFTSMDINYEDRQFRLRMLN